MTQREIMVSDPVIKRRLVIKTNDENNSVVVKEGTSEDTYDIGKQISTLGDLKEILDIKNINYDGKQFLEGVSNTELINDDSQLPTQVKYRDSYTSNLVILLVKPKNKIKNGIGDRKTLIAFVRANKLNDTLKEKYGVRDVTNMKTADIDSFVDQWQRNHKDMPEINETTEETPETPQTPVIDTDTLEEINNSITDIEDHVSEIKNSIEDIKDTTIRLRSLVRKLTEINTPKEAPASSDFFSEDEINNMESMYGE